MKQTISRLFKKFPKKMFAAAAVAMAILVPVSTIASNQVKLEGSLGVANVTAGDTRYAESVNAKYDEVVKVQVYYHNQELPDSGKVANNLRVKIAMPTQPGKSQKINGTISADNANTINDSVTVNLDREDAYLEYIPGSAVWKHNAGTNENVNFVEQKISDEVVYGGQGLVIENAKPCFNFEATVTVLARVRVPSVGVYKKVRLASDTNGKAVTEMQAKQGDKLEYLLQAKNLGNEKLDNVVLRDALPKGLTFVPGTVKLFNGPNPNGAAINNDYLFKGGVNTGSVGPGASTYITFQATVDNNGNLKCGANTLRNIVVVDTDQTGEYNNNAVVTVNRQCENKPVYSCDLLEVKQLGGRKISATVKYTASNGATFKNVTYNFGDQSAPLVTDKTTVEYEFTKDGNYTITATPRFTVNGKEEVATSEACAKTVKFESGKPVVPETPSELPNTGAGSVAGIVAAVTAAGAASHNLVTRRKR